MDDSSHPRWHSSMAAGRRLACLLLLLLPFSAFAEKIEQLKPTNYVNDFAGVLDTGTVSQLNAMLQDLEKKTGAQVSVVTVKSLEEMTVEDFGNRLFTAWGIGSKKRDRG